MTDLKVETHFVGVSKSPICPFCDLILEQISEKLWACRNEGCEGGDLNG